MDKDPHLNSNIVMVNLDDYSKNQSSYDLWPYKYYAETFNKISKGDPNSYGIDILFTLNE